MTSKFQNVKVLLNIEQRYKGWVYVNKTNLRNIFSA